MSQRKYLILSTGVITTAGLRILMAPLPNIEPVMLSTLSFGVAYGPLAGFLVGALSMLLSNFFLLGSPLTFPWILAMPLVTAYTSLAYGFVGLLAGLIGEHKKNMGRASLGAMAGALTIIYDLITAVCFAIQFYGPSGIPTALMAQIPFTLLHLTNVLFALLFAPYLVTILKKTATVEPIKALNSQKTQI